MKIFKVAEEYQRKLAKEEKPSFHSVMSMLAYMIEFDLSKFRMGDSVYKLGGLAEVFTYEATPVELKNMPEMAYHYKAWWENWVPDTEVYPESSAEPFAPAPKPAPESDPDLTELTPELTESDVAMLTNTISYYMQNHELKDDYIAAFNRIKRKLQTIKNEAA